MTSDVIVNQIITDTQPELVNLFWGWFGEEAESERVQELLASMQLYAGVCMRKALVAHA